MATLPSNKEEILFKGGVPKFFLLHHSTHFWVPIMKIYFFWGVNMDFLFLFDCDCLRHKEGKRCTLVNADSCDSRTEKCLTLNFVLPRLYKRCMTYDVWKRFRENKTSSILLWRIRLRLPKCIVFLPYGANSRNQINPKPL